MVSQLREEASISVVFVHSLTLESGSGSTRRRRRRRQSSSLASPGPAQCQSRLRSAGWTMTTFRAADRLAEAQQAHLHSFSLASYGAVDEVMTVCLSTARQGF